MVHQHVVNASIAVIKWHCFCCNPVDGSPTCQNSSKVDSKNLKVQSGVKYKTNMVYITTCTVHIDNMFAFMAANILIQVQEITINSKVKVGAELREEPWC